MTLPQPYNMNSMIASRDENGIVKMASKQGIVTAQIPLTRSMIGIAATNGIINGAEYREDCWVYIKGKRVRKWHNKFQEIRIWEPKYKDLKALYYLYKKTQAANNAQWERIAKIMHSIWESGPVKNKGVIAHACPTHSFTKNNTIDIEPWWEYTIHNKMFNDKGLSYSFQWLDDGKPKKLVNHKLGQKLYVEEQRMWNTTSKRYNKVKTIFYEAMKRSLPKAEENKVISLQFDKDTFWFYTATNGELYWWVMFDDACQFEIKKVL